VYCFDGDSAGRRAAWRALENSLAHLADGKQVRFLFLPDGEDPDTYVRKHGQASFEGLVGKAVPLSRFLLDELGGRVDLAAAEGRARLVHEAKPLLKQMPANALRLQLVRELAEKSRLAVEEVTQLCDLGRPASATARPVTAPTRVARKAVPTLASQLLRLLVSNPAAVTQISEGQRLLLDSAEYAPVAELVDALQASGATTSAMMFEVTRESPHAGLYQDVAGEALVVEDDEETVQRDLKGIFEKLELGHVENEIKRLNSNSALNEAEKQLIRQLFKRQAELKGAPGARPGA
jgi:DNA primase